MRFGLSKDRRGDKNEAYASLQYSQEFINRISSPEMTGAERLSFIFIFPIFMGISSSTVTEKEIMSAVAKGMLPSHGERTPGNRGMTVMRHSMQQIRQARLPSRDLPRNLVLPKVIPITAAMASPVMKIKRLMKETHVWLKKSTEQINAPAIM